MASASERARADAVVQVRMPKATKDMLAAAAEASGKTLSTFIIESASGRATDLLLDRLLFDLSEGEAEAFARALESPPPPSAALRKLAARSRRSWD